MKRNASGRRWIYGLAAAGLLLGSPAFADQIEGQVLSGGAPIAKSMVMLWSSNSDAPIQLGQAQAGDDGRFTISFRPSSPESVSYLVATSEELTVRKGGNNPAITLLYAR